MALSCVSKDRISWCLCSPSLTRCPHCSSELDTFDFRLSISVSASRRASAKVNFSAWKIVKLVSHWLLQHLACDLKRWVIYLQLFNRNLLVTVKCCFVWRKMFGCSNVIFFVSVQEMPLGYLLICFYQTFWGSPIIWVQNLIPHQFGGWYGGARKVCPQAHEVWYFHTAGNHIIQWENTRILTIIFWAE